MERKHKVLFGTAIATLVGILLVMWIIPPLVKKNCSCGADVKHNLEHYMTHINGYFDAVKAGGTLHNFNFAITHTADEQRSDNTQTIHQTSHIVAGNTTSTTGKTDGETYSLAHTVFNPENGMATFYDLIKGNWYKMDLPLIDELGNYHGHNHSLNNLRNNNINNIEFVQRCAPKHSGVFSKKCNPDTKRLVQVLRFENTKEIHYGSISIEITNESMTLLYTTKRTDAGTQILHTVHNIHEFILGGQKITLHPNVLNAIDNN
jgi:hypothetical protein